MGRIRDEKNKITYAGKHYLGDAHYLCYSNERYVKALEILNCLREKMKFSFNYSYYDVIAIKKIIFGLEYVLEKIKIEEQENARRYEAARQLGLVDNISVNGRQVRRIIKITIKDLDNIMSQGKASLKELKENFSKEEAGGISLKHYVKGAISIAEKMLNSFKKVSGKSLDESVSDYLKEYLGISRYGVR